MKTNIQKAELRNLSIQEMQETNGGIWQYVSIALGIYSALNMLAFGIGYAVGTVERLAEKNV